MTNSISDIADAEVIIIMGSNTTEAHPIIALEVERAVVDKGARLIVIDPRKIDLVRFATLWLRPRPGANIALLNAMMNVIIERGLHDQDFIAQRTEGFDQLEKIVAKYSPEVAERISGVPASLIRQAALLYAQAERASTLYAMGITQHSTGTDNVLAIASLAMMTGNIGRPGAGVNPLRGHNNVQGSCDMGALPNVYSGYQSVTVPEIREKFERHWGRSLPSGKGLTVVEMMNAALEGKVRGMFIMGENPMLSDPDINHVQKSLESLEFLVVQDLFVTETGRLADVILPGCSFAEKDGTFTNTERRVQRVRQAIRPVGESKPDWQILCEISERMGYEMNYNHPSEIMEEIAALTPIYGGTSYSRLERNGLQWPCPSPDHPGTPILHTEKFTRGLGKFYPVDYQPAQEEPDQEYPFLLTTGRQLLHFHTGTLTRRSQGLNRLLPMGSVEMNQEDATRLDLHPGDRVRLISRRGEIETPVLITEKSPPGVVFMSFHFWEAAVNKLTNPALDPVAKIPEYKVCAVRVEKVG